MRWILSWALYLLGDLVSKIITDNGTFYRAYNCLMGWSVKVQGDGRGPWE